MRAIYKKLILLFVILAGIKIALSFLIPSPTMFADEYYYSSMARSFLKSGSFTIFGSPSNLFTPLYPIILSIAYIFKDMRIIYMIFKFIGALLSSLIIFPTWLLAKEFLNERKAFLIAILCGLWPVGFIFSFFVMSENLFYVLVLFTIYFLYKSFIEKDKKWDFLTGLFLGLTYLTKVLGIILIPIILISSLIFIIIKKDFKQIKRKFLLYGIALLVVLPWLIRNGMLFGWGLPSIIGYANEFTNISTNLSLISIFYWFLIYLAYLILATGIIIFIFNLLNFKGEKLKLFSIISLVCVIGFIIISSIHSARSDIWRPIGRYIESCIPLMIILGFVNLKFKEGFYKNKLKYILISMFLIIAAFELFSFKLFPVNTISLSYIGFINFGIEYLLGDGFRILIMTVIFALLPLYLLLIKYINFKKLLYLVGLFFIMINIVAFSMIYYNSNYRWEPLGQMKLGLWFNDNIDSTGIKVLFDERDQKGFVEIKNEIERPLDTMAFWMNADAKIGNINEANQYDYVVSKHDLNYGLIKQIDEFKLYKVI